MADDSKAPANADEGSDPAKDQQASSEQKTKAADNAEAHMSPGAANYLSKDDFDPGEFDKDVSTLRDRAASKEDK